MNRYVAVAAILLLCLFCWYGVRTQVGNLLAELTSPSREDAREVADLAISLSPKDPRPRWLSAMALKRSFVPEDTDLSVRQLEEAVRRAPHDYRIWTDLGRAYEQSERFADSEAALRRAIELAPEYAIPHWQMANFLLRQDRIDEAKTELKKTTATSSQYRNQVFALAWDFFGKNPAIVEELVNDSPDVRVNLADFYAQRGNGKDSLRMWNSLSADEKVRYEIAGQNIARRLYRTGLARDALTVAREVGLAKDVVGESVNNGGFETFIGTDTENLFGWNISRSDGKFEAMPDSQVKSEGSRSLKISFRNYVKPELYNITQVVTVEPGRRYRLTFKLRTDNLRSGGPPLLDIAAYNSYQHIAATQPFPLGSSDWQEMAVDFQVPSGVENVELRTVRVPCSDECPIAGIIWYDDFRLTRL